MNFDEALFMQGRPDIEPQAEKDQRAREALHWLIALQETPNDEGLRSRIDSWRAASTENERAWAEAQRVWNVLGEVPGVRASEPSAPARDGRETLRRSSAQRSAGSAVLRVARGWRPRYFGGAAVAALLLFLFLPALNVWLQADYVTGTAELRQVRLDDGSHVHLGAGSSIDVAYDSSQRRVHLLSGEAYFEVVSDDARPFVVSAGGVDTQVLGTAFEVLLAGDSVQVAVERGRVDVSHADAPADLERPLQAGDWVRVQADGRVERGTQPVELVAAWRDGLLIVDDAPVGQVIEQLRRYHRGAIWVMDAELSERRITGVYRLDDPIAALMAIADTYGSTVRRIGSWVAIVSGR